MKQLKHAPGKWKIVDDTITLNIIQESTEDHIAFVYRESEANARLIAAAPEMLEALIEFCKLKIESKTDSMQEIVKNIVSNHELEKKIIGIIERATGMKIEETIE